MTGTKLGLTEIPHFRTENYSTLPNEILASPTELPSPLLTSEDFRFPADPSALRTERRLPDLEAKLSENQEKMSETLKSMTNTLTLLSHAALSCPPTSASLPTTRFQSELRPALPPKYDGNRQHGKAFINACQAFFRLRPTNSWMNKLKSNGL